MGINDVQLHPNQLATFTWNKWKWSAMCMYPYVARITIRQTFGVNVAVVVRWKAMQLFEKKYLRKSRLILAKAAAVNCSAHTMQHAANGNNNITTDFHILFDVFAYLYSLSVPKISDRRMEHAHWIEFNECD